jgi:hypothetical protein
VEVEEAEVRVLEAQTDARLGECARHFLQGGPDSWQPGAPMQVPAKRYQTWAGARLFESGFRQECGFDGPNFVCRPER